jgi:hypothetical protein
MWKPSLLIAKCGDRKMSKNANKNEAQTGKRQGKKRTGIYIKDINPFPASEVPSSSKAKTPFKELLNRIPKGQAIFITDNQVSLGTASQALRKLLDTPEFKDYKVTRRTIDGETRLYIINEGKQIKLQEVK